MYNARQRWRSDFRKAFGQKPSMLESNPSVHNPCGADFAKRVNLAKQGKGQARWCKKDIVCKIDDEEMTSCQLVVALDMMRKCHVSAIR